MKLEKMLSNVVTFTWTTIKMPYVAVQSVFDFIMPKEPSKPIERYDYEAQFRGKTEEELYHEFDYRDLY
jgi:hypothetical protein